MAFERCATGYGRDCGSRRRSLRSARAAVPRMESSHRSRARCHDSARGAARREYRAGERESSRRRASSHRRRDAPAAHDESGYVRSRSFTQCSQHPYRIDINRKKYIVALCRRTDFGAHRGNCGAHRFQFARFYHHLPSVALLDPFDRRRRRSQHADSFRRRDPSTTISRQPRPRCALRFAAPRPRLAPSQGAQTADT